jgi:phosphatidylglycerophosphatase A
MLPSFHADGIASTSALTGNAIHARKRRIRTHFCAPCCAHEAVLCALYVLASGALPGAGLSRFAPGTAGTLWAWLAFLAVNPYMTDTRWAVLIALFIPIGWWASSVTARNMAVLDPGSIVWDEVVAFWLVLLLVMPVGLLGQVIAFALFRFFDVVKPGPVGWADGLCHGLDPHTDPSAWPKAGLASCSMTWWPLAGPC